MVLVSEIRSSSLVSIDGEPYKVLDVVRHAGTDPGGGNVELKLLDLHLGRVVIKRFGPTEKCELVEKTERVMEYLYHDSQVYVLMDPVSFAQTHVSKEAVHGDVRFLKEGLMVTVDLWEDRPIGMEVPGIVELRVTNVGTEVGGEQGKSFKSAILENGVQLLVPQVVQSGALIQVDTASGKYLRRVLQDKAPPKGEVSLSEDWLE